MALIMFFLALLPVLIFSQSCPGVCQDNSLPCGCGYVAGLCPGPNNIQCCECPVPTPEPEPSPPPPPSGGCANFANNEWNCADPSCSQTVCTGCAQPGYQCAEFVSRTLASAGLIPLDPMAPQSEYGSFQANGKTYDLLWVSSKNGGIIGLDDYLSDSGWMACGASPSCVQECSALMVHGSEGAYSHTVVGIAPGVCDAHNMARYQVSPSYYNIDNVWNPSALTYQIIEKQRIERAKLPKFNHSHSYKKPHYKGI